MIRIAFTLGLLLATAHQALSQQSLEALAPVGPRLKQQVTVTADVVLIGDLVDYAGTAAGIAVFRAPDLGETGAVDIVRIATALRPHHIVNLDTGGLREVVVTRLSRTIPAAELEERVARALAKQYGIGDPRSLAVVTDRPLQALQVEASATAELAVSRVNVDPRNGRFDVSFELPGSAAARRLLLRITGTVSETVEIAMLLRAVARGDVVKAADIAVERRRKSEFLNGAILADQVVGMAAKRPLRPGEVLRTNDLARPEVVRRNETVTIVYRVPGITLTVRGTALEAGAVGDMISVTNIQSKRTVQATVQGPGHVVIAAALPPVSIAATTTTVPAEPVAEPEPPSIQ